MSVYRLTCFMKEEPSILLPLLLPLRFKWTDKQSVTWSDEKTEFKIIPFTSRGREKRGYRVLYKGNIESCQYLFNQFLGSFKPVISGIEWIHESEKKQSQLIRLAEQSKYRRCSLYGLYEDNDVGIVIMPTNTIHLQIRSQFITIRNVSNYLRDMETTASVFLEKPLNLFSFAEGVKVHE